MGVSTNITDAVFSINSLMWQSGSVMAWDLTDDADVHNIMMAALSIDPQSVGLDQRINGGPDFWLGTLAFTAPNETSSVEIKMTPFDSGIYGENRPAILHLGGSFSDVNGDFSINPNGDGEVDAMAVVPEPITMVGLLIGSLGLGRYVRKRK